MIHAPLSRCFLLSRSIDFHLHSLRNTRERAIGGIQSGIIGLNQSVTWEAIHLGCRFRLTSKITELSKDHYFIDEMVKGPFKSLRHIHRFKPGNLTTWMTDELSFETPYGLVGELAEKFILRKYLYRILQQRNTELKRAAESDRWKVFLPAHI